jgi:hypothetical protein
MLVLIVSESGERTAAEAVVLAGVRRYAIETGHECRIEDPDTIDRTGQPAEWLQSYLAKIKAANVSLPALVVAVPSHNGNAVVGIEPLPNTADEAIATIQANGG